jgi:hypothetical protein
MGDTDSSKPFGRKMRVSLDASPRATPTRSAPDSLGSLSGNYIRTNTTSAAATGDVESTQTIYDASLLFQYTFTRRFSMNARYSYTLSTSSFGFNDYDRSRFFLTGEYEF